MPIIYEQGTRRKRRRQRVEAPPVYVPHVRDSNDAVMRPLQGPMPVGLRDLSGLPEWAREQISGVPEGFSGMQQLESALQPPSLPGDQPTIGGADFWPAAKEASTAIFGDTPAEWAMWAIPGMGELDVIKMLSRAGKLGELTEAARLAETGSKVARTTEDVARATQAVSRGPVGWASDISQGDLLRATREFSGEGGVRGALTQGARNAGEALAPAGRLVRAHPVAAGAAGLLGAGTLSNALGGQSSQSKNTLPEVGLTPPPAYPGAQGGGGIPAGVGALQPSIASPATALYQHRLGILHDVFNRGGLSGDDAYKLIDLVNNDYQQGLAQEQAVQQQGLAAQQSIGTALIGAAQGGMDVSGVGGLAQALGTSYGAPLSPEAGSSLQESLYPSSDLGVQLTGVSPLAGSHLDQEDVARVRAKIEEHRTNGEDDNAIPQAIADELWDPTQNPTENQTVYSLAVYLLQKMPAPQEQSFFSRLNPWG